MKNVITLFLSLVLSIFTFSSESKTNIFEIGNFLNYNNITHIDGRLSELSPEDTFGFYSFSHTHNSKEKDAIDFPLGSNIFTDKNFKINTLTQYSDVYTSENIFNEHFNIKFNLLLDKYEICSTNSGSIIFGNKKMYYEDKDDSSYAELRKSNNSLSFSISYKSNNPSYDEIPYNEKNKIFREMKYEITPNFLSSLNWKEKNIQENIPNLQPVDWYHGNGVSASLLMGSNIYNFYIYDDFISCSINMYDFSKDDPEWINRVDLHGKKLKSDLVQTFGQPKYTYPMKYSLYGDEILDDIVLWESNDYLISFGHAKNNARVNLNIQKIKDSDDYCLDSKNDFIEIDARGSYTMRIGGSSQKQHVNRKFIYHVPTGFVYSQNGFFVSRVLNPNDDTITFSYGGDTRKFVINRISGVFTETVKNSETEIASLKEIEITGKCRIRKYELEKLF